MPSRFLPRSRPSGIGLALAFALVTAMLVTGAPPTSALPSYGAAVELNAMGGTVSNDGLHLTYGSGQLQVARAGGSQLSGNFVPSNGTVNGLLNGIYLMVGTTLVGPTHSAFAGGTLTRVPWTTISASTPATTVISSSMTYVDGPLTYSVYLTIGYDANTDQFYNESFQLYVPFGNAAAVKLYRTMDTLLDGADTGTAFYDTTDPQRPAVGIRSSTDPAHMLAFRKAGSTPGWTGYWSGESSCMYSDVCVPTAGTGFLNRGIDFPASTSSINTGAANNGIGVVWDMAALSGGTSGGVPTSGMRQFGHEVIVGDLLPTVINFVKPPDTPLTDGSIALPITGRLGYFSYTSATTSVCTVGGLDLAGVRAAVVYTIPVTFHSAGTCTIHADEAASAGHSVATRVTRSFEVTVPSPPGTRPTPTALTSSGTAPAAQDVSVELTAGNTLMLLTAGGQPVSTVTVTGGVYTSAAGVITFTPGAGYVGTPEPVTYQVNTPGGLTGTATYTPTVLKPAAPVPLARVSSGPAGQSVTIVVSAGQTISLLDAGGAAGTTVVVEAEGAYSLDATSGVITFSPEDGFVGVASGVTFRLTDAYAQAGTARYVPTVTDEAGPTPTPVPTTTPVPTPTPTPTVPPVPKPLPEIDRTELVKIPANPKAVKGKEKKTKAFNSSFTGIDAHPITKLGKRKLVKGEATTLSGDGLFGFDSGKLTKKGRAEVKAVVKNLRGTKSVHCEGYTDYAGDRGHELDLSLERAKAVCSALRAYGAKVITMTRGYGPKRPAVVGGTAKSRKENRRVVILVTT
jgi:CshA-type fibril repeat protein